MRQVEMSLVEKFKKKAGLRPGEREVEAYHPAPPVRS